jgi:hypothetical protein
MELLIKQYDYKQTEESSEECTPNTDREENLDVSEYDYNKRLWF